LKETYRVIDANINRISEGIRVIEDVARFVFDDSDITENLKNIRHTVRKTIKELQPELINYLNAVDYPVF
jgi:thiamine-phosphate pyrophosphorylase